MKPRISVAVATYNGEKFIEEQLSSILLQTMKVDQVVIRDDRSTDQTARVVQCFIKNNGLEDRFDFKVNETNLGYGSNFVGALRATDGDYVFFCDQDDIWPSDRVEKMVRILENNPEALMIGSEFDTFKSSEDAPEVPGWELRKFRGDRSLEKIDFNSVNIFIGCQGCTMAMKRSFLDRIDQYWYEGWAHDEFVWKMALALDGLFFYHDVTLRRRLHSNNVTLHKEHKKSQRLKYLYDLKKSHEQTLKFVTELYGAEDDRARLLKKHIRATQLRIDLIEKKKLINSLLMLGYSDCYHKRRAMPVEFLMALR